MVSGSGKRSRRSASATADKYTRVRCFAIPILGAFDRLHGRPAGASRWWPRPRASRRSPRCSARPASSPDRLHEHALVPGRLVGLVAPNGPGYLVGYLALRRCGLVAGAVRPGRAGARARGDPGALRCRRLPVALRGLAARRASTGPSSPGWARSFGISAETIGAIKLTSGSTGPAARGRRLVGGPGRRRGAARGRDGPHRARTAMSAPFRSRTPTASRASCCRRSMRGALWCVAPGRCAR